MAKKDKKKEKKRAKKLAKQQEAANSQSPVTPQHPIMVFYDKNFIEMIITTGELPEEIVELFAQAVKDCKPYEEAGLKPIIGYCSEPQRVLVTSVEKLEGLFIQ